MKRHCNITCTNRNRNTETIEHNLASSGLLNWFELWCDAVQFTRGGREICHSVICSLLCMDVYVSLMGLMYLDTFYHHLSYMQTFIFMLAGWLTSPNQTNWISITENRVQVRKKNSKEMSARKFIQRNKVVI